MDEKLLQELLKEIKDIKKSMKEIVTVTTDIKNLFVKYDLEEVFENEQIRQG